MTGDKIIVVDLGGEGAQTAARMLRSAAVYCEVVTSGGAISSDPLCRGLLLVGDGDSLPPDLCNLGKPVLAIGPAALRVCEALGGSVTENKVEQTVEIVSFGSDPIFGSLVESERYFQTLCELRLPEGTIAIAETDPVKAPMFVQREKRIYAMQWEIESNDPDSLEILSSFAQSVCGCEPWWHVEKFADHALEEMKKTASEGTVLLNLSGGIDSAVCAVLAHKVIGDRLKCLFVDNGLMRRGEVDTVIELFHRIGIDPIRIDASERVLLRLKGVTDPHRKREVVQDEMLRVISESTKELGRIDHLLLGTIYPDVLSQRNTDLLPANQDSLLNRIDFGQLHEPLRVLFKDEVRILGRLLGMPEELIGRQPFPQAGLAVRCIGEVTAEKLDMLSRSDEIFRDEIRASGLDKRIWQYFAILTGIRSRGFRAGMPVYEHVIALRAVSSRDAVSGTYYRLPYDLLERVVERITTEVRGVDRVVYDLTGKPPAMIEWE